STPRCCGAPARSSPRTSPWRVASRGRSDRARLARARDVPSTPRPRSRSRCPRSQVGDGPRTAMSVTLRRPGAAPATERVTVLSCDRGPAVRGEPDAALVARVHELARLPFVAHVLALPDLHQKGNAEVPSSLAVVTRDAIVPEFTSVAINDGMGVVLTDLEARDATPERIAAFFRAVNASAAPHPLAANRYSLSAAE